MSKTTSVAGGAFPCSKCDRAFVSQPALTMHINRVHRRTVRVPGQKQSEEERLAKKRAYNRKYRRRKGMKVRPSALKENKQVGWSADRRARFESKRRSNNHALSLGPNPEKLTSRRQEMQFGRGLRIPNNYCENCGYDQVPAQLAKGFIEHGTNEHRHGG